MWENVQLHSYIPSQDSEVPVLNCGEENDLLTVQAIWKANFAGWHIPHGDSS